MATANEILDQQFLEMRWRVLSLAADLDRVQRAAGSDWESLVRSEKRLQQLAVSLGILNGPSSDRAEQVQMLFSDQTPLA
ncbi:MAG: hypothetical protein H7Z14_18235 [Anaerolineae bacterium]|nr:hypothetical protein [Phycisphaerae bacterium]